MSAQKHLISTDYYHQLKKQLLSFHVLIPFIHFSSELERELTRKNVKVYFKSDKIFLIEPVSTQIIWAQDHWKNCLSSEYTVDLYHQLKNFSTIGYYHPTFRHKHIENKLSKLKKIPQKRITFNPNKKFNFKYYIWTIIDDLIIYSDQPSARYPAGWNEFEEDKIHPPNRAYLKLWEAIMIHDLKFDSKQIALEIGASPGGWSWVLSQCFDKVYTFDRAPLADKIEQIKNIKHSLGDAFKLNPLDFKDTSWFFSDLICTPEKIYEVIQEWLAISPDKNFMCTIKFKGDCDFEIIEKLLNIEHSKIVRLYQNKNEVTWIRQVKI